VFFGATRRLSAVEDEVARISRDLKAVVTEWEDMYDKLLKTYRRLARERAKLEQHDSQNEEESVAEPTNGTATGSSLSPRQKLIQQQILRRRAGIQ
jgi:hypothetical protein